MDRAELKRMLDAVAAGTLSAAEAAENISLAPIRDLGFAQLDTNRGLRQGQGEVVYGAGKTAEQIAEICLALLDAGQRRVLVTRIDAAKERTLKAALVASPFAGSAYAYDELAELASIGGNAPNSGQGTVLVICAGTSDLPVAHEAARTAEFMGNKVELVSDVGVAGIHRLLAQADRIAHASVIVCVAGMEGALASAVGGLASCPVIAVPTSVGYGANYEGLSTLLAMLNSCASGVSVVNIDNGFGAGFQAHLINHVGSTT